MSTIAPSSASSCASESESWLPVTNTSRVPACRIPLVSWASSGVPRSVRSPTKNSGVPRATRCSAGTASRLLCRSEATVICGRPPSVARSAGAVTSRASPTIWPSSSSVSTLALASADSTARSARGMSGPWA